ncbi:LysR family transcriptional regulator [Oceanicaulis alexandrii]|uniref:LysR family transcriptional regulator n=1 Tax=Oceanicaulis alexandrii TaxID=153233 RepID=UPI00235517AE|nr:LysR family transcriptional regulator [Oceanicaulis alexandrii]
MDRLSTLEVFRRVAECNGFSAAARDLGVSNAAVSKAVKELEARLGVQLIVRTTRSLSLTDAGAAYYHQTCAVLDALAEADEQVRAEAASPRGRLKVSAPMSMGLTTLSEALPNFCRQYPDILLDLHMSDEYVDLVSGGFDLAIRGGLLQDSSLKVRKLLDLDRIVCAAPSYLEARGRPASPQDLSAHDALVFAGSGTPETWPLFSADGMQAVPVKPRLRINNSIALKAAAKQGLGLALLPNVYVREDMASGALVDAMPGWRGEAQALYAVYPEQREVSRKVRVFLDFLVEHFRTMQS